MRLSVFRSLLAVIAAVVLPLLASRADAQSPLRGAVRLGGEYGGERVIEFQYEDGSTPDVTAGGGLLLTIGGGTTVLTRGTHALDAQVNVGLKYRTIPPANNQEVTWLRFPVEALFFYRAPIGLRVGGGATVHLANTLKASGSVLDSELEFKNSPGMILQAEYLRGKFGFDLRYTTLEYEVKDGSGTVDASSIGGGFTYFFGRSTQTPR